MRLTLLSLLFLAAGVCSAEPYKPEPLPAPKLKAEPVRVVYVRQMTLIERIRERRLYELEYRLARLQEAQARSLATPVGVRGWIWIR